MEVIKVYDHKKGKEVTVGKIDGDCFIKIVKPIHYMRKYDAYGIDAVVLERLRYGNRKINHIILKPSRQSKYISDINDWIEHGIKEDFGHGVQYFLPCDYFKDITT